MAKLYIVGGAIRDKILGIVSKDIDYTFVLDESQMNETVEFGFSFMENYMKENGFEIFLSTPAMFTIRAKFPKGDINEKLVADFVMARKENGYYEGTRNPILSIGSLRDDLIRRDFTINAMCEDVDGNLIDLFGGQDDLKNKILKTPLDPAVTMMDDPLRILRACRFSITRGFSIHESIWNAMNNPDILNKMKMTVSGERIREEIYKMMKHDTIETIRLINHIDANHIPGFLNLIFGTGLWLKPTFEKI